MKLHLITFHPKRLLHFYTKKSIPQLNLRRSLSGSVTCRSRHDQPNIESSERSLKEEEKEEDLTDSSKYEELFSENYLRPSLGHKVFVIQPDNRTISKRLRITTPELQLSELCTLVQSLPSWTVVDKAIYPLKYFDKKTLFGSGTFAEIGRRVRESRNVTAAVLGIDMLTGAQLSTLQDSWGVAVYDRYTIVLQIFQTRARTKAAKLQVALAEIPYYRSRLQGMHSGSLDQQRGGMKFIGGSGETFIETRNRLLRDRETKLRRALDKLKNQRELVRHQRVRSEFPIVAVVGYTNAGKTSLIKALTGDESMQPKDMLFATLDVTAHAGTLPNRLKVLFVDTVGFISDIPTSLIGSFSATLEDIAHADVLVHVRDVSHPDAEAQRQNVLQTLDNLQLPPALIKNMIEVGNKADLVSVKSEPRSESGSAGSESVANLMISVKEGWGLSELSGRIQERVMSSSGRITKFLRVPMNGPHLAWLYKEATVESTESDSNDPEKLLIKCVLSESAYRKFLATFRPTKPVKIEKKMK